MALTRKMKKKPTQAQRKEHARLKAIFEAANSGLTIGTDPIEEPVDRLAALLAGVRTVNGARKSSFYMDGVRFEEVKKIESGAPTASIGKILAYIELLGLHDHIEQFLDAIVKELADRADIDALADQIAAFEADYMTLEEVAQLPPTKYRTRKAGVKPEDVKGRLQQYQKEHGEGTVEIPTYLAEAKAQDDKQAEKEAALKAKARKAVEERIGRAKASADIWENVDTAILDNRDNEDEL